jgi:hypothetical protein
LGRTYLFESVYLLVRDSFNLEDLGISSFTYDKLSETDTYQAYAELEIL